MKRKKSTVVAGLSLSAVIALSGAAAKASPASHCQTPRSVQAVSKTGRIVPVNLISGAKGFSLEKAAGDDCCGPYSQKCCPKY